MVAANRVVPASFKAPETDVDSNKFIRKIKAGVVPTHRAGVEGGKSEGTVRHHKNILPNEVAFTKI